MPLSPRFLTVALALLLAACGGPGDLSKPPVPFGDFRLGYDIVVAEKAETVGPSRKATPDEWKAALKSAIDARIGRYQGDKLYHLGVAVNAYALAVPGIPVVISPKSVLVISVDVWDDTAQRTVNAETKQFRVFEGLNGATIVGSGLTRSREEQMKALSENAARQINDWLIANKAWFTPEAVAIRATLPPMTGPKAVQPAAPKPPAVPAGAPASAAPKPAAAVPPTSPLLP